MIDHVSVEKGYEKALGAALGDDLDAPVDASRADALDRNCCRGRRPALPDGAEPLSKYVKAPAQLARWLSQIGVVERDAGVRLAAHLKTGQRLVSREGDLWRWGRLCRRRARAHRARAVWRSAAVLPRSTANWPAHAPKSRTSAARLKPHKRRSMPQAPPRPRAARVSATQPPGSGGCLRWLKHGRGSPPARDEASAAKAEAERALGALQPAADLESRLAGVRDDIAGKRAKLAEVRAEQQAIVREAEMADRRLAALAADRTGWDERQAGARNQMATLDQRIAEAKRDRAELENAPQVFAEKAPRADQRDRDRRSPTPRLRRPPARGREPACRVPTAMPAPALEAASAAREELARAEERFEGASAGSVTSVAKSTTCWKSSLSAVAELAGIKPGEALPDLADIEATLERLRRERERLGAVNLRARGGIARGRKPARLAHQGARRPGRGDQEASPGHPEPQPRGARAAACLIRAGQQALPAAVHPAV